MYAPMKNYERKRDGNVAVNATGTADGREEYAEVVATTTYHRGYTLVVAPPKQSAPHSRAIENNSGLGLVQ